MTAKDYSIGLDIGAASIGFSAIDEDYKPVKMKGKTVLGARLFEEGQTAAERRGFRTMRRRLKRRKWRLALLEEFFDPYMAEVDPTFFARLKQSNLSPKDEKKQFAGSLLFPDRTDSDFYDQYPTIYHLRKALMNEDRQFDLREVFLAIHHIVKYRGNFLNPAPVSSFSTDKIDFRTSFETINASYKEFVSDLDLQVEMNNLDNISQILLSEKLSNIDKQRQVAKVLLIPSADKGQNKIVKKIATQMSKAFLGYKFDLAEVLRVETEEGNKWKIQFSDENIDQTLAELLPQLNEHQQTILNVLSKLYSQITLNDIIPGGMTLSESMIQKYNDHHEHLEKLKKFAKTLDKKARNEVMEAYAEYVGNAQGVNKVLPRDEFYKQIKRHLDDSQLGKEIQDLISNDQFMPKQRSNQNGVIPYQLHLKELNQIIEMQGKYYPWLAELNSNESRRGKAKYKLSELVAFRIPYYVGPLITKKEQQASSNANFAWMVRKEAGRITPWNFDQKVDRMKSANRFIKKMTNKDTYLLGEDVLPAHSLLYERFTVLNELNMVRANGHRLSIDQKQRAYNELFKQHKTVKADQLANLLVMDGMPEKPLIKGLSDPTKFNSSLGTYVDFKKIFGDEIDKPARQNDFEQIIEWISVFEDRNILKAQLQKLDWLTSSMIDSLLAKRYTGWGRLSKKLLTGLKDANGKSVIDLM